MSTETTQPQPKATSKIDLKPFPGGRYIVMHGLDWKGYSAILRATGDRTDPKMVYLDGSLWLMSAGFPHEFIKARAGRIVDEVCVGVGVRCIPSGSTTFRRKQKRGGCGSATSALSASLSCNPMESTRRPRRVHRCRS
ncbi:MAG: hypothetical protein JWN86_1964 [Planctomycetota bacterium]|nr:hypothetical protein [Planctomycetota bacterium]